MVYVVDNDYKWVGFSEHPNVFMAFANSLVANQKDGDYYKFKTVAMEKSEFLAMIRNSTEAYMGAMKNNDVKRMIKDIKSEGNILAFPLKNVKTADILPKGE